jgi:hypothetical protein
MSNRQAACDMAGIVAGNWKQALRKKKGTSGDGARLNADAFEHDEAEMAWELDDWNNR